MAEANLVEDVIVGCITQGGGVANATIVERL
jgi:hypothetical protein